MTPEPTVSATQSAEQAMNGEDLGKRLVKTDDQLADDVFLPAEEKDLGAAIADEINDDLAKKKAPPKKRGRKPKKEETDTFKQEMENAEQKQNEFANWAKNSEEKDKENPF